MCIILNIMDKQRSRTRLFPSSQKALLVLGENIHLARLRRKLSMEKVAERADISRSTLIKIEKGDSGVAMGSYVQVLFVLRLDQDLMNVAKDDELGRKILDAGLVTKQRAPKRKIK